MKLLVAPHRLIRKLLANVSVIVSLVQVNMKCHFIMQDRYQDLDAFVIAFSSFRCLYIKVYILFSSTLNARVLTSHFSSSNQSLHLEVHWS